MIPFWKAARRENESRLDIPLRILKRLGRRGLQFVALMVAGVLVAALVGFYAEMPTTR
jgi:hypothetical protein